VADAVTGITSNCDALWQGVLSYAWAWGHENGVDLRVYAHGAWTAKVCLHSG